MNIKGIHKTSLIDYPGKVSTVLFTGGCNLRCGYCHNPDLACDSCTLRSFPNEDAITFIKKRKDLIDGVTISGGEPTLSYNIERFIRQIKELSLLVKIDTNGLNPHVIERLLAEDLVDYIALDIKTSREKYRLLTGRNIDFSSIIETVGTIKSSAVDYEIRTTCIPYFVQIEDFKSIKLDIGRVKKYFLQQFINEKTLDASFHDYTPYPPEILERFRQYVLSFADVCCIRGI